MSAAVVAAAGLVADKHAARAERVAVPAALWRSHDDGSVGAGDEASDRDHSGGASGFGARQAKSRRQVWSRQTSSWSRWTGPSIWWPSKYWCHRRRSMRSRIAAFMSVVDDAVAPLNYRVSCDGKPCSLPAAPERFWLEIGRSRPMWFRSQSLPCGRGNRASHLRTHRKAAAMKTLLASHNEELYTVEPRCVADIADIVRDNRLQVLTSTDGTLDFWFSHRSWLRVNRHATALLMATTRFTAHEVALLRGDVVITTHDSAGQPASLTDSQLNRLINSEPSWREERILRRRFARDLRAQRRARAAEAAADCNSRLQRAFGRTRPQSHGR